VYARVYKRLHLYCVKKKYIWSCRLELSPGLTRVTFFYTLFTFGLVVDFLSGFFVKGRSGPLRILFLL
jgi:hypothetical protein